MPAVIYITALTIFPSIYAVYVSFLKWNLATTKVPTFIGLQNYISAVTDPLYQKAMFLTFAFAGSATGIELLLGIGVAHLINRKNLAASIARSSLILPLMMAPFLVYMNWVYLLGPGTGPIPYFWGLLFGNANVQFFSKVPTVYFSFLVVDIWQWLPFVAVIILAGLRSLSSEPYEAAEIDGAGSWAKFRYITLPLIQPVMGVVVLFRLVDSLKLFDPVIAFTSGGPGTATYFLSYLIFKTGFGLNLELGLSTAYGQLFLILVLVISWGLMYFLYRGVRR